MVSMIRCTKDYYVFKTINCFTLFKQFFFNGPNVTKFGWSDPDNVPKTP